MKCPESRPPGRNSIFLDGSLVKERSGRTDEPVEEWDTARLKGLLHQHVVVRAVGLLPGGHVQCDGQPVRVAADMELAREATARAPETLSMSPPLPPAAQ